MRVHQSLLSKLATVFAAAVIAPSLLADTPLVEKTWYVENVKTQYSAMPAGEGTNTLYGSWGIPVDDESSFTEGTGITLSTGDTPITYTPSNHSYATLPVKMTFNVQFTSTTELPEVPAGAQLAVTAANTNNTGAAYFIYLGSGTEWTRLYGVAPVADSSVAVVVEIDYAASPVVAKVSVGETYLSTTDGGSTELALATSKTQVDSLAFGGSGVLGNFSGLDNRAAVASAGSTNFETLPEALAAVTDNGTVTLLADVALTDRLFVNAGDSPAYAGTNNRYATTTANKTITLNLNGHNITSASNIALAGGSLNITGTGTISTSAAGLAPVEVRGTGDLTSKRTLTIGSGVTLSGTEYGLNIFGSNDAQKNIIDVTVNGTVNGTLFVLGNLTNAQNEINIVVNGTVDAPNGTGDDAIVGIALNGNANVTVNADASVSGDSGIEVRAGTLTVNGGTITAEASTYSYIANGDGCTTKGAAIAIAQHTTQLPTSATLNGGTLVGAKQIAVTDVNSNMSSVTVLAAQGYTQNSEVPTGYSWVETATSGVYTLAKVWTVTFESDGTNFVTATVVDGETVAAPSPAPTKAHYTLQGWKLNGSAYNFSTAVTGDITLVADWLIDSYALTINYVDGDNNVMAPAYTATVEYGASYSVSSPEVTGYTPGTATVTGTMVAAAVTETVTYTKNSYALTINYVDGDNNVVAPAYTATVEYGASYSVNSPEVTGYTPDQATVSGMMGTEAVNVTVTYTVNAATVLSIALNTNAVDNVRNGTLAATSASGKTITVEAMLGLSGEGATPEMTASPNGTVSGNTATFAANWNAGVEWTLTSGDATLVGKTYAKGEAEWFTTPAADVAAVENLGFGDTCTVGVKPENATQAGEAVRIEARITVTASGSSEPPAVEAVGDARGGFAVVNSNYVAFNGTSWVTLNGIDPIDGEVDLLMVADMAAATPTVRYYVDGVALYAMDNETKVYAIPLGTVQEGNNNQLQAIGFSSADIVKSAVVAEYDVSYVAAKGDAGYTTEEAAVAAIDKTGQTALEILKAGFAEGIALAAGDIVKIDTTNGTYTGTVSTTAPASKVKSVTEGNVTTYTVVITPTYFIID